MRAFAALVALLGLAIQAIGCGCDGHRENLKVVKCGHWGTVDISSPTFSLPPTAAVTGGGSCLLADDTCFGQASVMFDSSTPGSRTPANGLFLSMTVMSTVGMGTHNLIGAAPDIVLRAGLNSPNASGQVIATELVAQSGWLDINENSAAGFSGTFELEGDSADAVNHLSLTNGAFAIEPCAIETETVCIPSQG
jgi:hypothetical protein